MHERYSSVVAAACLAFAVCCLGVAARAGNVLNLLPTPKALKVEGGSVPLTAESRIVATDPKLMPLAGILSDEILLVTKLRLAVVEGPSAGSGKAGSQSTALSAGKGSDIVLKINPKLQADSDILTVHGQDVLKTREYAHTITVADQITIEGWDYRAVCEGTATLLQAIQLDGGKVVVPKMTIKDWPYSDFGAIMPDCAREHQPIYVLKMAAETCRLFKVRYLHLHLSEDNGYTFPSTAYPQANSIHYPPLTPYTLEELRDLVAYADARGVTCVPELEGPGHCTALLDSMKGKLGDIGNRAMAVCNPDIYPVLDTLVGEMCDVFKSSPYFHIGGDEVEEGYAGGAEAQKYMKEHNITDKHAIWLVYAQNMAKIVKKYGKKTLMWDGLPVGCPLDPSLVNDIILYVWFPRAGRARAAQDMGYTTITVPWDSPPFPEFNLFTCNNDVLTPRDKVLGHCRPMWEMDQVALANGYLTGTPERQERTWGPDNVIEVDYHKNRLAKQNARVDMIVRPVTIGYEGNIKESVFNDPITITMSAAAPGVLIRYRLDGEEPTLKSPLYEKPFKAAESLNMRAALFDKNGRRLGNTTVGNTMRYVHFEKSLTTGKPVSASSSGGSGENPEKAEYAADGWVDGAKFWGSIPAPQWLQVDLENEYSVDRIQVVPYFDGIRYYQYTVSVGTDSNKLIQVVDASTNAVAGTENGYMHKIAPTKARYIRVDVLKNSDNPATHLVEVRAWETGK